MPYTGAGAGVASGIGGAPNYGTTYLDTLGFGNLLDASKTNISQLLSGLPSPDLARTANAYFGAASGVSPTSDFLRNRGYDLYNAMGEQRRAQGQSELTNLIGTVSGPELSARGQNIQSSQFGQNLFEQQREFDINQELQQFLAQLQAIGLGQNISNSGRIGLPQLNY